MRAGQLNAPASAPAVSALARQVEQGIASACLKSVIGRAFVGRRLRVHRPEVSSVPSSKDVVLAYRARGTGLAERWYGERLSNSGSSPGRVTVMPSGRMSSWRIPQPIEVLHLYVPGALIARLAEREFGVDPARIEIVDSFAVEDPVGAELAQAAVPRLESSAVFDGLLLDAVGQAAAVHILRRHAVLPPAPVVRLGEQPHALSPKRLRRLRDFIEAHLDAELRLEDLAEATCLSTFHLSRCFRQTTGTTLHAFVMLRRVERARVLLADGRQTLADIAYRCGFASQSHFTSAFKKRTGLTPGSFRKAGSR